MQIAHAFSVKAQHAPRTLGAGAGVRRACRPRSDWRPGLLHPQCVGVLAGAHVAHDLWSMELTLSARTRWPPPCASPLRGNPATTPSDPAVAAAVARLRDLYNSADVAGLVQGIRDGKRVALSRGITLVESSKPEHKDAVRWVGVNNGLASSRGFSPALGRWRRRAWEEGANGANDQENPLPPPPPLVSRRRRCWRS